MNLLIEYFKSQNTQRDIEYKTCISENIKNELIKKIIVFISDNSILDIKSDKIEIIQLSKRPTFKYLFEYCNNNCNNEICIVANTDIFFDQSLSIINDNNMKNVALSLTRWDIIPYNGSWGMRFFDVPYSQDSWIFKSPIRIDDRSDFLMGKRGCDNRISQILHELNYDVKNPGKQIITKHFHITNYRTYGFDDMIHGPYLTLIPNDNIDSITEKKTIPHF